MEKRFEKSINLKCLHYEKLIMAFKVSLSLVRKGRWWQK